MVVFAGAPFVAPSFPLTKATELKAFPGMGKGADIPINATAELFNLGWTLRRSHQILTLPLTLRRVGAGLGLGY